MRVYVVATYPTVRAGLAALVREQAGWEVVGQAAPDALGAQGVPRPDVEAAGGAPDVVLADLDAGDAAIEEWLAALQPRMGLVALMEAEGPGRRGSAEQGVALVEVARAAEERGLVFGALRRDATPEEIAAALTAAGSGLVTLDRRLAQDLLNPLERHRSPQPVSAIEEPLTARELEVLQLMAQGLPNKLIAQRLRITEHTAKFHVSAILTKLHAASRTEAVTLAARRGLLIL